MALERFVYKPRQEDHGMSKPIMIFAGRTVKKNSKAQGYGLHSREERNFEHY